MEGTYTVTPLHHAAFHNDVAQVRALLAAGADVDALVRGGWTPLHMAAQEFSLDAARLLLDRGAAVDPIDESGRTPLFVAVYSTKGRADMIALLRSRGADPFHKDSEEMSPIQLALGLDDPVPAHCFDDLVIAQEHYKTLVRDYLSPAFRSMGLKGSSGRYQLPVGDLGWLLVRLAKWKYSNRVEIEFRITLFAVSATEWSKSDASHAGRQPDGISRYHDVSSGPVCLGDDVLGVDHWWELNATTDLAQLSEHINEAMRTQAMPWLRDRASEMQD